MATKKTNGKNNNTNLYLVAPSSEPVGLKRVTDASVQPEGIREAWRAITGGRQEIKVTSATVRNQINNYITVLREVAEKDAAASSGGIKLSEITLSLTISAEGNIGIASTSAEAGLTLVFKRD